jgi:hypothetical protein
MANQIRLGFGALLDCRHRIREHCQLYEWGRGNQSTDHCGISITYAAANADQPRRPDQLHACGAAPCLRAGRSSQPPALAGAPAAPRAVVAKHLLV